MFEADTTYLWQTRHSIDAKTLCASSPASFFQAQSEFSFNHHHPDMGISVPVPFFFTRETQIGRSFQHKLNTVAVRVFR